MNVPDQRLDRAVLLLVETQWIPVVRGSYQRLAAPFAMWTQGGGTEIIVDTTKIAAMQCERAVNEPVTFRMQEVP